MNLCKRLKKKEFTVVRKWIVHNLDNDPSRIFRRIYDNLYDNVDAATIPHAVIILGRILLQVGFRSRPRD